MKDSYKTPALDERLARDCHRLGRLERATLLLHRAADIGWLILVPDTEARDWHELDDAEHERIGRQIRDLSVFANDWFTADKINVAALGNEVPQMHIHIVARRQTDICWPKPIWGHLPAEPTGYGMDDVEAVCDALVKTINLQKSERGRV